MSQAEARIALSDLPLSEKLNVIRLHGEGKSTTSIASNLHVTEPVEVNIFQARAIHESPKKLTLFGRTYA